MMDFDKKVIDGNKMKSECVEELIERSCDTCEFNFGNVCAGSGTRNDNGKNTYGMSIEDAKKMFPEGCKDYGISLYAFIEQEIMNGR